MSINDIIRHVKKKNEIPHHYMRRIFFSSTNMFKIEWKNMQGDFMFTQQSF